MSGPLRIEPMTAGDAAAVLAIYAEGIATGHATFQSVVPTWDEWDASHAATPRLIARDDSGRVLGWAALAPVSKRDVYRGVGEHSVYVAEAARGRGVGLALLQAFIVASEAAGYWTLIAGVFPENTVSVVLHERCGFRLVGRRERIGFMDGRWRDTLMLERRSAIVGVDPAGA